MIWKQFKEDGEESVLTRLSIEGQAIKETLIDLHRYELQKGFPQSLIKCEMNFKRRLFFGVDEARNPSDLINEKLLFTRAKEYYSSVYRGDLVTLDVEFDYVAEVEDESIRGQIPILLTNRVSIAPVFFSKLVNTNQDLLRFTPARLACLALLDTVKIAEIINFNPEKGLLAVLRPSEMFHKHSRELIRALVRSMRLGLVYHGCPPNRCILGSCG